MVILKLLKQKDFIPTQNIKVQRNVTVNTLYKMMNDEISQ